MSDGLIVAKTKPTASAILGERKSLSIDNSIVEHIDPDSGHVYLKSGYLKRVDPEDTYPDFLKRRFLAPIDDSQLPIANNRNFFIGNGSTTLFNGAIVKNKVFYFEEINKFIVMNTSGTVYWISDDGVNFGSGIENRRSLPSSATNINIVYDKYLQKVLILRSNGILMSDDINNSESWTSISTPSQVQDFAYSPTLNRMVYISFSTTNCRYSDDDGQTWNSLTFDPSINITNNKTAIKWVEHLGLFIASYDKNLMQSADGINFTPYFLGNGSSGTFITHLIIDEEDETIYAAATEGTTNLFILKKDYDTRTLGIQLSYGFTDLCFDYSKKVVYYVDSTNGICFIKTLQLSSDSNTTSSSINFSNFLINDTANTNSVCRSINFNKNLNCLNLYFNWSTRIHLVNHNLNNFNSESTNVFRKDNIVFIGDSSSSGFYKLSTDYGNTYKIYSLPKDGSATISFLTYFDNEYLIFENNKYYLLTARNNENNKNLRILSSENLIDWTIEWSQNINLSLVVARITSFVYNRQTEKFVLQVSNTSQIIVLDLDFNEQIVNLDESVTLVTMVSKDNKVYALKNTISSTTPLVILNLETNEITYLDNDLFKFTSSPNNSLKLIISNNIIFLLNQKLTQFKLYTTTNFIDLNEIYSGSSVTNNINKIKYNPYLNKYILAMVVSNSTVNIVIFSNTMIFEKVYTLSPNFETINNAFYLDILNKSTMYITSTNNTLNPFGNASINSKFSTLRIDVDEFIGDENSLSEQYIRIK